MIEYKDFEEAVYNGLQKYRAVNSDFTFSVRQKASKGSETDYFIGTQKFLYFGFTCWWIPIYFPGSSSDIVDFIFKYRKDGTITFHFEAGAPKAEINDGVIAGYHFVKKLGDILKVAGEEVTGDVEKNRNLNLLLNHNQSYSTLESMWEAFAPFMTKILGYVDQAIALNKVNFPHWVAERLSKKKFEELISKMEIRREKHKPSAGPFPAESSEKGTVSSSIRSTNKPNNQILYGPPGTGKTYETIVEALKIVCPESCGDIQNSEDTETAKREKLTSLYHGLTEKGIISFCTFHQSMTYEDFIEGIKPNVDEDNEGQKIISYSIEDGIFKKLAITATYNLINSKESDNEELVNASTSYDRLWDELIVSLQKQLAKEPYVALTSREGIIGVVGISDKGNIILKHDPETERTYTVSYSRLRVLHDAFPNKKGLSEIGNINTTIRTHIGGCNATAFYAVLDRLFDIDIPVSHEAAELEVNLGYLAKKDFVEKTGLDVLTSIVPEDTITAKNYVLIIDEINRGNVSAIFGELITLIEDDKRLGTLERLTLQLPYSKKVFGVPTNLYIIGTMNTADRSVEALDTALRRRFSFVEMLPKPELLKTQNLYLNLLHKIKKDAGDQATWQNAVQAFDDLFKTQYVDQEVFLKMVSDNSDKITVHDLNANVSFHGLDLSVLLTILNDRITHLLDNDHQIGHAYFIHVRSIDDLKKVFANKIVPLLQEFFFRDYGKIGMVLGEGFIQFELNNSNTYDALFPKFEKLKVDVVIEDKYQLKNIAEMTNDQFMSALKQLWPKNN